MITTIKSVNRWTRALIFSVASLLCLPLYADDQSVEHLVNIESFTFSPATLEVKLGDTIVWVNKDIVPHTATDVDELWDTDKLEFSEQGSLLVTENVLGEYFCRYHPAMKGAIVLRNN